MPNHRVFAGLWSSCAGCHGEGSNKPYFANLLSFETQLAYSSVNPLPGETIYVVPGDSGASELLKLLDGSSSAMPQMPPGANSYADLVASGSATDPISMSAIADWIDNLEICELPAPTPRVVGRRMNADMIRRELMRQLDLNDAEIASTGRPLGSPDDSPQRVPQRERADGHRAWEALGGAHILDGRRTSEEVSESLLQTFIPVAQAWCAESVQNKTILFRHANRDSDSATQAAAIRQNIEYLFLHMLGEQAAQADVEAVFNEIFVPTERDHDAPTAWTAVCAYMIRDPLWLTY